MTFRSDFVAAPVERTLAPAININQIKNIVSPSPLSAYFKECLATVGAEATLQLLLALHQRPQGDEADSGDPLEPYAHEAVGTGYADEFLT